MDDAQRGYDMAMANSRAREHGQAVLDFLDFIARYPSHPLASSAQYWIGEAYYVQRDYHQALVEFQRVVDMAPSPTTAAEALLKIGLAHTNRRENSRAQRAWQRVVHDYPATESAGRARALLREHTARRPETYPPRGVDPAELGGSHSPPPMMTVVDRLEPGDPGYPARLGELMPAPALWVRGGLEDHDALAIAIVGSRRATPYGLEVAAQLARDLAARGVTIVSGFARGVDSAAHRAALDAGGRTVAVLGCGIDVVYPPENRRLVDEVAARGALVTQFPPGTAPLPYHFPTRNRTLAALVLGVVVVEAAERSGSLSTAGFAADLGREVYAVPGKITSPTSAGVHRLLRDGARLVETWTDVVQELPDMWRRRVRDTAVATIGATAPSQGTDEERMLQLLMRDEAQHIERLIARAGMDAARAGAILTALELGGWARQLGGQRWIAIGARSEGA